MTTAVIIFFICLGAYLIGLFVFYIIKRIRNKKHFKKEIKEKSDEQVEISTDQK